jgi:hypothetical protein
MEVNNMTYHEALQAARAATTYTEADAVCKAIEDQPNTISDRQYYNIRNIAINAAYAALIA